mmetsp:Transcript_12899/g.34010  ORF Transcript_12899/g.34010 Transcript_12899/m.34010 type:complete len:128 (-) Transcript_12899:576-959(-)
MQGYKQHRLFGCKRPAVRSAGTGLSYFSVLKVHAIVYSRRPLFFSSPYQRYTTSTATLSSRLLRLPFPFHSLPHTSDTSTSGVDCVFFHLPTTFFRAKAYIAIMAKYENTKVNFLSLIGFIGSVSHV